MEFKSIEEIKQHFGLDIEDINEIKKTLKQRIKTVHSDKTGGTYKSAIQKREHEEISAALDFIDNSSTEIAISRKEWTDLQVQFEEFKKIKTENDLIKISEIGQQLDKAIQTSVVQFQKKHFTLKLSSLIATTIISALWIFPFVAAKHPLLNILVNDYKILFTIIWAITIALTGLLWVYIKRTEKIDITIKQNYNLDSIQAQIFKIFLAFLRIAYNRQVDYDSAKNQHVYIFSRDQIFNFLLNHYYNLNKEFNDIISYSTFDLYMEISKIYKNSKDILRIKTDKRFSIKKVLQLFLKIPGEMDIDLAQKITDSMLRKLIERDVIKKHEKQLFNDTFIYFE